MKKSLTIFALVLTLFLTSTLSAGIYFSQPEEYYNIGDTIKSNITIEPIEEGFLTITLICDSKSIFITPTSNRNGQVSLEFPLTTAYIEDITGSCHFIAEYPNGANGKSQTFQISKQLSTTLSMDALFAKPGESITISGFAKRLNGVNIDGEVEITIPSLSLQTQIEETQTQEENNETNNQTQEDEETPEETTQTNNEAYYGQVKDGQFSVTFVLPKDMGAGEYKIEALAFEEKDGERTSEGITTAVLSIKQIETSIELAINQQNIDPGDTFEFKPILKDQTGTPIPEEISVIIVDENLKRVFEKLILSEATTQFLLPTNQSTGYYQITAYNDELNATKQFYINEKEKISFRLENETLIATNIGNIPYKQDIQVDVNGKPFVRSLDLNLDETHEFKLTGSNEEYDIKISDGETELTQQGVALTGHAISVKDITSKSSLSAKPIIWIFFIIVLGAGLLIFLRKIIKKKSFTYPFKKKDKSNNYKTISLKSHQKAQEKKQTSPLVSPNQAEQVLVLQGEKSTASVVVLKIKNKISAVSKQSLEKAIEPIYEKRGAVHEQGDYIFIIFSPLMTKTQKNEAIAAKAAKKIQQILNDHNKKFQDKIDYGISINSGDIINKVENNKLKFTALKNIITSAKRLAESSDKQILVTKEAYERGISELKAEKRKVQDLEVYELRDVIDQEQNKKFLKGFLGRMETYD